jgi:hypothetical protein
MFENWGRRGVFHLRGMKGSDWRRLHNEEHHNLYPSEVDTKIGSSGRIRTSDHAARMGT